jgi:hypothetical protein
MQYAHRRLRRNAATSLGLHAMAARGDPKAVTKRLKELERE